MEDDFFAITMIFLIAATIGFLIGWGVYRALVLPDQTFKAVCRVQGGTPYESVSYKDVCIKGGVVIPVSK